MLLVSRLGGVGKYCFMILVVVTVLILDINLIRVALSLCDVWTSKRCIDFNETCHGETYFDS